jgi:hypothetical protein
LSSSACSSAQSNADLLLSLVLAVCCETDSCRGFDLHTGDCRDLTFSRGSRASIKSPRPFPTLLPPLSNRRFLNGTDEERVSMFKLIPHIPNASWVIKQSVGTVPVILGNKLKTTYYQTDRRARGGMGAAAAAPAASAANEGARLWGSRAAGRCAARLVDA